MRETVKSRRVWAALAFAWALGPSPARAQGLSALAEPPPESAPVELDPWLPTGAELAARTRRPPPGERGCSFRAPVCVQPGPGLSEVTARRALAALERAYQGLVWAMRLPAPLGELDLYLQAGGATELAVERGPIAVSRFDSAPAFCVLTGAERALIERDATLCVAEAIAWRLDASASPHVKRAYAAHLWLASEKPTSLDDQAIDEVQAHPELGLMTRERSERSEGAALFFEYLDWTLAKSHSGVLATALLAAAADKTPPGFWQWDNEPDVLDVLRHTAGKEPRATAKLLGDLAVTRAFVGDRSDGAQLPTLDFSGAFGRVRFDWVIPLSSLPRRVASTRPIEEGGSIYVWIAIDQQPQGSTLAVQASWEPPVSFQWTLVRVAADGRELGRVHPAFQERGTEVEQRLVNLDRTAGILVVGTNLGGIDLKHPLDPDVAPFEPHACTIYVARL